MVAQAAYTSIVVHSGIVHMGFCNDGIGIRYAKSEPYREQWIGQDGADAGNIGPMGVEDSRIGSCSIIVLWRPPTPLAQQRISAHCIVSQRRWLCNVPSYCTYR